MTLFDLMKKPHLFVRPPLTIRKKNLHRWQYKKLLLGIEGHDKDMLESDWWFMIIPVGRVFH
jgi:hypothetical protein